MRGEIWAMMGFVSEGALGVRRGPGSQKCVSTAWATLSASADLPKVLLLIRGRAELDEDGTWAVHSKQCILVEQKQGKARDRDTS